jgi:hypothetical protein
MTRALAMVARLLLGLLLAIGIAFAIQRGMSVTSADPGALARQQLEDIAAMSRLAADSPEYIRLSRELPLAAANLNQRPAATVWHLVPGVLFFALVTLQFSRRLRARHPSVHRWNGRAMLALIVLCAGAGIYLGLASPYGGALESGATTVFGLLFIIFGARGYAAIRRRDVLRHREWMIRMFALGIAISVIRVIGMVNVMMFGTEAIQPRGFALSLWFGWLLSLAVAELWIRSTRPVRRAESETALQPL